MLSSGNSNAVVTAINLTKIARGECFYDRIRGLNPDFFDKPTSIIKEDIKIDIRETLGEYEPRVNVNKIEINAINEIDLDITVKSQLEDMENELD